MQPLPVKICTNCNCSKPLAEFYTTGKKVDGSAKYNSWCKICIKEKMATYHRKIWGRDQLQYTAYKRTKNNRAYLTYLLGKAKRRGECSIDLEYLCNLWTLQNGKCAVTGWELTMRLADGVVPTNASIDRIDSSIGYKEGNVQLVCRCVNVAKHDLSMNEFVMLCKAVIERTDNG